MVAYLADADGILLRRDAVKAGFDDNFLQRQLRANRIVRIRQGAYAVAEIWAQADPVARHRLLNAAVMRQYDDHVALSHTSATVEHGGPTWGLDLSSAHLTNLYGLGERKAARIVHHRGLCRVGDVSRNGEYWISSPTRAALDTASLASQDVGVCVIDWYVRQRLTSFALLEMTLQQMQDWPHTLRLLRVLQLSDGLAESIAESRTRLMLRRENIPDPVAQYEIFHPSGRLAGRVDFAWPEHRLMLEFDGHVKYTRFLRPGESVQQAVLREKAREDLLRELTGWSMIRLVWSDLDRPGKTAARIRRAMARVAA